jgi:glycosyltransferase involved in cell wall biosynthesis
LTATSPSVVHVLWGGQVGGIERLVHDLAVEQSRLGMEVSVAFAQATGSFADRGRDFGLRVIDLRLSSGYDVRPWKLARAAAMLASADVVHAHAFNIPLGEIMRQAGRPVVFTHHGNFGQGRRLHFTEVLKLRIQRRFLTRQCAAVAANSRWTAERLAQTHRVGLAEMTVVYNGTYVGMTTAPEARENLDELVVIFVGRLAPFKRVDRIIHAVARLRPRRDLHVMIAGSGPLEDELRTLARDLGIEPQVDFLGWQSDIAVLLNRADVLVLPSQGEPFGLAVIEASARGLLTIAFADGGGVLECMAPDGRVVRGVDELAAALGELKGSEALSTAAREARSLWARSEFPIAKTAKRYLELYRLVADEAQPAATSGATLSRARRLDNTLRHG